jgi:hypothetical protein
MTRATTADSSDTRQTETVDQTLRAAHEIWLRETDELLTPLLAPRADFWKRWTAVRYLADQFLRQYSREWALLGTMRPFIGAHLADELQQDGEQIAELQRLLDQAGRRRGTGLLAADLAGSLLEALRSWCADLEAAASEISRDQLPKNGRQLLTEVELYARVHLT